MPDHDREFVGPVQAPTDNAHSSSDPLRMSMIETSATELEQSVTTAQAGDTNTTRGQLARVFNSIREAATLAGFLRLGGAALMVLSLSLFLMQGVEVTNDLQRYLLLLGQTVLLTAAGFAVGYLLKEPRGARMFFSLGLISIPANFAVLGAMIYSIAPLDTIVTHYPGYASWQTTGLDELLLAAGAGLLVLLPMSVFCFAVMARQSAWWLSAGYLLSCATLLIPVRETFSVTIISTVCTIGIVALLSNRRKSAERQVTSEERFANVLLFVPPALMLVRAAMLYNVEFHFALAVVTAVYFSLRHLVSQGTVNSRLSACVRYSAATTAMVLAVMLTSLLASISTNVDPLIFLTLTSLALNVDLTRQINQPGTNNIIHACWAILCFSAITMNAFLFNGTDGLFIDVILAGILMAAGFLLRQGTCFVLGSVALTLVFLANGSHLLSFIRDTGWIGLAVAGASTIVAGSLLERFWPVVKLQALGHFRRHRDVPVEELAPETNTGDVTDLQTAQLDVVVNSVGGQHSQAGLQNTALDSGSQAA